MRIPLWLKIAYSAWLVTWAAVYASAHSAVEFLWFCHVANFVIAAALWSESRLLISWQAVSVLLVQILWTLDVLGRLVLGWHPIGGTEFLFNPHDPLLQRVLASFHTVIPLLLIFAARRLGYDRRALLVQVLACWAILPASYFLAGPEKNLNWVYKPFEREQSLLSPPAYLVVCMLAYPLLIYVPSQLVLARLFGSRAAADPSTHSPK